ncbi:unnamed protein product, partial [Sphenostylis stenocarpa]
MSMCSVSSPSLAGMAGVTSVFPIARGVEPFDLFRSSLRVVSEHQSEESEEEAGALGFYKNQQGDCFAGYKLKTLVLHVNV